MFFFILLAVQQLQIQNFLGMYPALRHNFKHVCPCSHNGEAPEAMTVWGCGTWWVAAPLVQKLALHGLQLCKPCYVLLQLNIYIYNLGVSRSLAGVLGPWFQERACQRQDVQNGKLLLTKSDTISVLSWVICVIIYEAHIFYLRCERYLQHDVSDI